MRPRPDRMARNAALAARAVHVDPDRDPLQVAVVTESFDSPEKQEDREQHQQQRELAHAAASAPESVARAASTAAEGTRWILIGKPARTAARPGVAAGGGMLAVICSPVQLSSAR